MNEADIVKAIAAEMGKESIRIMSDSRVQEKLDVIPTGSFVLDEATGIGGWPRGRLIELYGELSAGKSTLVAHAIANCQKLGLPAALVDSEHAYSPDYAAAIGVDNDRLIVSQEEEAEKQMKIIKKLINLGCGLVALDSIAAMVTMQESKSEEGSANIASLARLLSAQLKQVQAAASIKNCCVILCNQVREKPGVMYGNPIYTPGGKAPGFYASLRVKLRVKARNKNDIETAFKVEKNKVARPFVEGSFLIEYGKGVNQASDILEAAVLYGVIERKGSTYEYMGKRLGVGKAKAVAFIDTPARINSIRKKIYEKKQSSEG